MWVKKEPYAFRKSFCFCSALPRSLAPLPWSSLPWCKKPLYTHLPAEILARRDLYGRDLITRLPHSYCEEQSLTAPLRSLPKHSNRSISISRDLFFPQPQCFTDNTVLCFIAPFHSVALKCIFCMHINSPKKCPRVWIQGWENIKQLLQIWLDHALNQLILMSTQDRIHQPHSEATCIFNSMANMACFWTTLHQSGEWFAVKTVCTQSRSVDLFVCFFPYIIDLFRLFMTLRIKYRTLTELQEISGRKKWDKFENWPRPDLNLGPHGHTHSL